MRRKLFSGWNLGYTNGVPQNINNFNHLDAGSEGREQSAGRTSYNVAHPVVDYMRLPDTYNWYFQKLIIFC